MTSFPSMDILRLWPDAKTSMRTKDLAMHFRIGEDRAYQALMRLAIIGYFDRSQPHTKPVIWTITPKGRAAADELRKIHA